MSENKPTMEERMAAWQKYAGPGPEHKVLDMMKGTWRTLVKMYGDPGGPPQESQGRSEYAWVLGGNVLREDFQGEMGGAPFQGIGHVGYDRQKGQYWQIWMDSMSTGCFVSTGKADASGRAMELEGPMTEAATGEVKTVRTTVRVTPERLEVAMSSTDPQGHTEPMMEILYTRTK